MQAVGETDRDKRAHAHGRIEERFRLEMATVWETGLNWFGFGPVWHFRPNRLNRFGNQTGKTRTGLKSRLICRTGL